MRRLRIVLLLAATQLSLLSEAATATVDFAHDIVPVLRQHCGECHTGDKKKGGLSLNTRESLLKGGENGAVVTPGKPSDSKLLSAVLSRDPDTQMPPKGARLTAEETSKLTAWIAADAPWTEGFSFKKPAYEPPLKPRRPALPQVRGGRTNLIDRILDAQFAKSHQARPEPVDDATFARRVHLDLVGLLPDAAELKSFLADRHADKRARLIQKLLTNDIAYTEHWLSFWNDLLRNDYAGTGYIDGGRKAISTWLYRSLIENKPYDQFARELISPNTESEGFARGIQWRGAVSAGQVVPVQFAQSVGQTFLGINLKCASCHDSFIDRWTLQDSYGLAAIYSEKPLELHRCDKPTGRMAKPAWLFPELGQIHPDQPRAERLQALSKLLTHPENGRFTRTIVNRFWHRLMGHGIVHPTDAMQTEPWNADLLDALAVHLADNHYNLKATLALIANSAAYQSKSEIRKPGSDDHGFHYAGPRAKRLSAEQFIDALWQLTDTAPDRYDAPVVRARSSSDIQPTGRWIWTKGPIPTPQGDTATFRATVVFDSLPKNAGAAITADNAYTLYLNGKKLKSDDAWDTVESIDLTPLLRQGTNEFLITARNGGDAPNPAGLFFEARWRFANGKIGTLASGTNWLATRTKPNGEGKLPATNVVWEPVVLVDDSAWRDTTAGGISATLRQATVADRPRVRVSLLKSDLLQRTLGRPNREQIVSVRPDELSTLEAMDLSNGPLLAARIHDGAKKLSGRSWKSSDDLVDWLYRAALSRPPARGELELARNTLGNSPSQEGVEDLLWSVLLLPEFQLVR